MSENLIYFYKICLHVILQIILSVYRVNFSQSNPPFLQRQRDMIPKNFPVYFPFVIKHSWSVGENIVARKMKNLNYFLISSSRQSGLHTPGPVHFCPIFFSFA